jgi:hypothetical protein
MNAKSLIYLLLSVATPIFSQIVRPDPNTTAAVLGKSWLEGGKLTVMRLAEARLQKKTGDLASQLVLMEYATAFMDTETLKTLVPLVRRTSQNIKTPSFLQQKKLLDLTLESLDSLLPTITDQMRAAEAYKGALTRKPLSMLPIIEALESDGLVAKLTSEEKTLLNTSLAQSTPYNEPSGENQNLRSLPLIDLQKRFPPPKLLSPTSSGTGAKPTAPAPSGEPSSSTPWSIIVVLIVAATGLLWLLVKNHRM